MVLMNLLSFDLLRRKKKRLALRLFKKWDLRGGGEDGKNGKRSRDCLVVI